MYQERTTAVVGVYNFKNQQTTQSTWPQPVETGTYFLPCFFCCSCFFCFKADLKARKQTHVFERYYQCNLLLSCHMFSCCLIKVKTNLGSWTTFATQGSVIAAWPFKDPIAPNIWITGTLVQVRLGPSRKLMTHSIGHWMPIHCHHGCNGRVQFGLYSL